MLKFFATLLIIEFWIFYIIILMMQHISDLYLPKFLNISAKLFFPLLIFICWFENEILSKHNVELINKRIPWAFWSEFEI